MHDNFNIARSRTQYTVSIKKEIEMQFSLQVFSRDGFINDNYIDFL